MNNNTAAEGLPIGKNWEELGTQSTALSLRATIRVVCFPGGLKDAICQGAGGCFHCRSGAYTSVVEGGHDRAILHYASPRSRTLINY